MPQIVIRRDGGGGGGRLAESVSDENVLIIISNEQVEVYTGQDALDKTAKE